MQPAKGRKMSKKNSIQEKCSSRERILVALHTQPVDRIPFVLLISTFTSHRYGYYDFLEKEKENEHG